jgi:hypothetical protein
MNTPEELLDYYIVEIAEIENKICELELELFKQKKLLISKKSVEELLRAQPYKNISNQYAYWEYFDDEKIKWRMKIHPEVLKFYRHDGTDFVHEGDLELKNKLKFKTGPQIIGNTHEKFIIHIKVKNYEQSKKRCDIISSL